VGLQCTATDSPQDPFPLPSTASFPFDVCKRLVFVSRHTKDSEEMQNLPYDERLALLQAVYQKLLAVEAILKGLERQGKLHHHYCRTLVHTH
jgi:hypothetical protein